MRWILRTLAYLWASPYTLTGIAIGLILGGRFRLKQGVVEIHGARIAKGLGGMPVPAMAMTFGHVVFGVTEAALDITRTHEHVHVRQYERWGPFFVPAYLGASAILYLRGRDGYRDNPFEIEAYAIDTPDFSQSESSAGRQPVGVAAKDHAGPSPQSAIRNFGVDCPRLLFVRSLITHISFERKTHVSRL